MNKLTKVAVFMVGTFICASSVFAATTDDNMNTTPTKGNTTPTSTLTTSSTMGSSSSSYNKDSQYNNSDSEISGLYLGAKLGMSFGHLKEDNLGLKYKTKNAPNVSLTLGYDFNEQYQVPIRTEFDYTFRKGVDIKEHADALDARNKIRLQTAMLNAYYDIHTDTPITPYLGVGLGYANLKAESEFLGDKYSASHNKLAWTVGAGVGYKVNEHVDLLVGYQYLQTDDIKTDIAKIKASSHDIFAGVNYYF